MLIAIDSNVFIAALSSEEDHSPNAQKLLREVDGGKHTAIASSIVFGEVLGVSDAGYPQDIEDFFRHIDNFTTIHADDNICTIAGKLRRDHTSTIKLPDAIHLATALSNNADLFITNDSKLAKYAQKLVPTKLLTEY